MYEYTKAFEQLLTTNNVELIKLLLSKGVDPNFTNKFSETALMIAARCGNCNVVELLLKEKADRHRTDVNGWTALTYAISKNHISVVELLLDDQSAMMKDVYGQTPLIQAAIGGNIGIVRLLLKYRTRDVDIHGANALRYAIENMHEEVAKFLIEHGSYDVNEMNKNKEPLLIAAIFNDSIEVVHCLLDKGADPNSRDIMGCTALNSSIASDDRQITKRLLEVGADPNAVDGKKELPIDVAIIYDNPEAYLLLIEAGANTDILIHGRSIIEYAKFRSSHKILELYNISE